MVRAVLTCSMSLGSAWISLTTASSRYLKLLVSRSVVFSLNLRLVIFSLKVRLCEGQSKNKRQKKGRGGTETKQGEGWGGGGGKIIHCENVFPGRDSRIRECAGGRVERPGEKGMKQAGPRPSRCFHKCISGLFWPQ